VSATSIPTRYHNYRKTYFGPFLLHYITEDDPAVGLCFMWMVPVPARKSDAPVCWNICFPAAKIMRTGC
jgi:hypothetical protein